MSDDSFAALDAILQQEADVVTSLSEENARLRALLEERDTPAPAPQLDAAALLAELQSTKAAQAELFRELKAMREAQAPAAVAEDHSDEVALLRESLADLANQLASERSRVSALEAQRREEEEKVTTLRSTVEESRRAVMRLQNEAGKRTNAAASLFDQGYSFPPRRPSFTNTPRRRSSLGLAAITGSPSSPASPREPSGVGLGFDLASPTATSFNLSTSPASTATASHLARLAHRRGSASISAVPSGSSDEDDRAARLRELRLGVTSTKIHSRRNSAVTGLPEFATPFDWDLERRFARRMSAASSIASRRHRGSICEEGDSPNGPPSANLRMLGRKDSCAVFEAWSRRSSSTDSMSGWPSSGESYNSDMIMQDQLHDLQLQLQGLRIQLAESEEGRRASELCLQALKEFISKSNPDAGPLPISLPPLPTDASADYYGESSSSPAFPGAPRPAPSRWSISRLSLSSRRESANTPTFSAPPQPRRTSAASSIASATGTYHDSKPTPSLPSFGSFSFSALVSRPSSVVIVDADTSPKMSPSSTMRSSCGNDFPVEPSPLLPSSSGCSPSAIAASAAHKRRSQDSISSPLSADEGDCLSIAPSLVSDLSSRGSSRASSPEVDHLDGFDSPRVVIDFVDGESTVVEEAARMPVAVGKSSLTTFARAVGLSATAAQ
ncbi:hypothetical protein JCM6882_007086 [Rhodosporidiobolus microsporus]